MKTSRWLCHFTGFLLLALLGAVGCKNASPAGEKGAGGVLSGPTSNGGCYNAYYPATATLKKTYKIVYANNQMPPATYTESYANLAQDGFQHKITFPPTEAKSGTTQPLTVEGGIKCQPAGLMAMEYGSLSMGQNTKFKFKTIKAEGVTFPNESDWKVGHKWTMTYEVEGQMTGVPAAAFKMSPQGTIAMNSEIVGTESVTVPAGTFQAFKVSMTMSQKLNMNMMGRDIPMDMSFKTTSWFAKDVGMVKAQTEEMGATTELVTLAK